MLAGLLLAAASSALAAPLAAQNATGAPVAAGEAYVGKTLTAGPGTIDDDDGLTNPSYSYVWTRVDADGQSNPVQVGTAGTYTLVADDEGKKIKLEATFTDDDSNSETRDVLFPSVGTVAPTPGAGVVWATTMTVGEASTGHGYETGDNADGALVDDGFTHDGTSYVVSNFFVRTSGVSFDLNPDTRLPDNLTLEWAGEAFPLSASTQSGDVEHGWNQTWVAANASSLDEDNYETTLPLGATVNVLLRDGNTPATGAPAVAGEAYVGRTLGAGPGDIDDDDGLTTPGYSYVWTRVDDD
ncbi:MAG: hypothetical protein F4Z33_01580, partial [Gemmatimonadales bacterium]|nr:hypothetical protein [Gemmatimonadales bacterium]